MTMNARALADEQRTAVNAKTLIYQPRPVKSHDQPRWLRVVTPLVLPVIILALWEIGGRSGVIDGRFFSFPSAIVEVFLDSIRDGSLAGHFGASLTRILIGFLVGAVPGVAAGLLLGVSAWARMIIGPTLNALYPLPKIAILPLFIMIFGLGETSKIATIAIGVFFPVMINAFAGVGTIDKIYLEVGRNYGAGRLSFYRTIALPGALPFVFAGLRIGFGVALLLIVAAEFVGTTSGIGYMIWNSWQVFRIEDLFIGLMVIAALGVLGNAILKRLERTLCPWRR